MTGSIDSRAGNPGLVSSRSNVNNSAIVSTNSSIALVSGTDQGTSTATLAQQSTTYDQLSGPSAWESAQGQQLHQDLSNLAHQGPARFRQALQQAFGGKVDAATLDRLLDLALAGDLPMPANIRFVDAGTLGPNAMGAYSTENGGTIFLDRRLLSDAQQLQSVFTEEFGHHLDAMLGGADAAGDEGAIFAQTLLEGSLSTDELSTLRSENDAGLVLIDGRSLLVEFSMDEAAAGLDDTEVTSNSDDTGTTDNSSNPEDHNGDTGIGDGGGGGGRTDGPDTSGMGPPPGQSESDKDEPDSGDQTDGGGGDGEEDSDAGWFSNALSWTRSLFGVNEPVPSDLENRTRQEGLTDTERQLYSLGGVLPTAEPGFQVFNFLKEGLAGLSDAAGYAFNTLTGGYLFKSHASRFRGSAAATAHALANPVETLRTLRDMPNRIAEMRARGDVFGAMELERQLAALGLGLTPAGALGFNSFRRVGDIPTGLPGGFQTTGDFTRFGQTLNSGLADGGFTETRALLQGSAVTGNSFRTGQPFDAGRVSDFDIALAGQDIFDKAQQLGIGLRSGGTRTGPLTAAQVQQLGLRDMQSTLSRSAGRPVNFMIYRDPKDAANRAPSIDF